VDEMKAIILTTIDFDKYINQRTHHIANFLKSRVALTILSISHPDVSGSILGKLYAILVSNASKSRREGITHITVSTRLGPFPRVVLLGDLLLIGHMVRSLLKIKAEEFDICIAESPWAGVAGWMLKKLGRIKFLVYEDLDLFPEFIHKNSIAKRVVRWLESFAIKKCDLLITVGEELAELRKTTLGKNAVVVENGVDYINFSKVKSNYDGPLTMIYIGSIEDWAGVLLPIEALPTIRKHVPDVRYLIVGSGSKECEEKLKRKIIEYGFSDCVEFLGRKQYQELPGYLQQSNIGIATFRPIPLMKYAFTLKVMEYLAAGLMVIGTDIGETGRVLRKTSAGIPIAYNTESLVEAVKAFKQSDMKELSKEAKEFASAYSWDILMEKEWQAILSRLRGKVTDEKSIESTVSSKA